MDRPEDPVQAKGQANKQLRACDACRGLKTKCVHDVKSDDTSCTRCVRLRIPCKYSQRVRKKQRKRTDARVAVLERELESLRSTIIGRNEGAEQSLNNLSAGTDIGTDCISWGDHSPSRNSPSDSSPSVQEVTCTPIGLPRSNGSDEALPSDATFYVRVYIKDFLPLYPVVQLDENVDVDYLTRSNPLLLRAIVGVASIKECPAQAKELQTENIENYARCMLSETVDRLDLIQAVLVTVTWYLPPRDLSQKRKFYELAHLAISAALEAGLDVPGLDSSNTSTGALSIDLTRARTLLGCYMLSQGMSMTLRRPSLLRSSAGLSSCIALIGASSSSRTFDQMLLVQATLLQIVEEINSTLSYSDPHRLLAVSDDHVASTVQYFRCKLNEWKDRAALYIHHDTVGLMYNYTIVYLHEIVLYVEHDPHDFIAPFKLDHVGLTKQTSGFEMVANSALLSSLLEAAYGFIDVIVSMSADSLRILPVGHYFRLVYICFVLTKLAMSHHDSKSKLGALMHFRKLRTEHYRSLVLKSLTKAAEGGCYPGPKIFLEILAELSYHWDVYAEKTSIPSSGNSPVRMSQFHKHINSQATDTRHMLDYSMQPFQAPQQSTCFGPFFDESTWPMNTMTPAALSTETDSISHNNSWDDTIDFNFWIPMSGVQLPEDLDGLTGEGHAM